jgi:hypothetical protein
MLPLRSGESAGEVSLFPLSLISRPDGQPGALAFVLNVRLFLPASVSLATIDAGEYAAVRADTPLFTQPPFFVHAARRDGEYITLYACSEAPGPFDTNSCVAGRVHQDQVADPGAYQVRRQEPGGSWTWSSDLEQGTPVLENVFKQLSVTRNDHLGAYLAVYGERLSNDAVLRTARAPEGPWSAPVRVALPAPPVGQNSDIREHASIVQRCESRILLSYFAPTRLLENGYPADGEVVLAAIDLQEDVP